MATPTAVVPADIDVRDWLATPVPFNTEKYSGRAIFSAANSVVELQGSERQRDGCIIYTRDPLPVGKLWQTTVLDTTRGWIGRLVSGCV